MARFVFPVRGRGKNGVTVTVACGLLACAWRDIRQAIPDVDALMDGDPIRVDDGTEPPPRGVRIGECVAVEPHRPAPLDMSSLNE